MNVTLKSGHVLEMQMAPFSTGMKLVKALSNELKTVNIDLGSVSVESISGGDFNTIKNLTLQLIGSDAVERCVFECLGRCLLDDQKITPDTFNNPDMRGDYLPAAWEVTKFNVAPFFEGLDLKSLTGAKAPASGPK